MGKIIVLDELTASQIAAGEVIERPASVVKETVENSIDAGATVVTVEIRNGGIKYIHVTDNGCGFEADDAVIAFDKHATSKIRSGDDLMSVRTLGFRGEALASIAAVADVELLSRTESDSQGVYVHVRGGDVLECSSRGSAKGTVLTVKDLFFNVPARYKFLKKDQTEAGYVTETVEKLALANPRVSFRLVSNGQEVLRTPGSGLESAVYAIFGKEAMRDLLPVSYTDGENAVAGFAGVRGNIFGTRSRQFYFVNGRSVKSRVISSAVDEAYNTVTMKHRFPMCIITVRVPESKIDVNVHPAKTEVRFAAEHNVYNAVRSALSNALLLDNKTGSATGPSDNSALPSDFGTFKPHNFIPSGVSSVENPVEKPGNLWKSDVKKPEIAPVSIKISEPPHYNNTPESEKTAPPYETDFAVTLPSVAEKPEGIVRQAYTGVYNETDVYTRGRIIGQFLKTYILLEIDGELAVIDQHAAHERIKYEAICEALDRADAGLAVSPMLLPVNVRLSAAEKMWLEDNIDAFTSIGFEIDDFGPDTVTVRAVPSALSEADPEDLITSGIRAAMSSKGNPKDAFRLEAVDTMACKAAVKANHALSETEIKGLLASLAALKNSATCPHGRPIVIRIGSHELEKRFKRVL